MSSYTPRRASKHWLEGAPTYILDVLDDKKSGDRYTVLFCGDFCYHTKGSQIVQGPDSRANTYVQYLGMSGVPSHPQGISMWGELGAHQAAAYRARCKHHRVRWVDLPENIRRHVVARATST